MVKMRWSIESFPLFLAFGVVSEASVWPGLRLIGAGGKIPKHGVRLDNSMRLKN